MFSRQVAPGVRSAWENRSSPGKTLLNHPRIVDNMTADRTERLILEPSLAAI